MPAAYDNNVLHMSFEGYLNMDGFQTLKKALRRCGIRRQYTAIRIRDNAELVFRGPVESCILGKEDGTSLIAFLCSDEGFVGISGNPAFLLINPSKRERWAHVGDPIEDIVL